MAERLSISQFQRRPRRKYDYQRENMAAHRWILLAEDNANDADLTLRALSANQASNEVILASDGVEVLDCLYRRGRFDRAITTRRRSCCST